MFVIALLAFIVLILLRISYQLERKDNLSRTLAAHVTTLLAPKEYSFLDALLGKPNDARSIVDQLGEVIAQSDQRLGRIEDMLAYFRNYFWEIQDPRYREDVLHPPESVEWKKKFQPPEDTSRYGIWIRERDMSEGFHRGVVRPTSRRSSVQEADFGADEEEAPDQAE